MPFHVLSHRLWLLCATTCRLMVSCAASCCLMLPHALLYVSFPNLFLLSYAVWCCLVLSFAVLQCLMLFCVGLVLLCAASSCLMLFDHISFCSMLSSALLRCPVVFLSFELHFVSCECLYVRSCMTPQIRVRDEMGRINNMKPRPAYSIQCIQCIQYTPPSSPSDPDFVFAYWYLLICFNNYLHIHVIKCHFSDISKWAPRHRFQIPSRSVASVFATVLCDSPLHVAQNIGRSNALNCFLRWFIGFSMFSTTLLSVHVNAPACPALSALWFVPVICRTLGHLMVPISTVIIFFGLCYRNISTTWDQALPPSTPCPHRMHVVRNRKQWNAAFRCTSKII